MGELKIPRLLIEEFVEASVRVALPGRSPTPEEKARSADLLERHFGPVSELLGKDAKVFSPAELYEVIQGAGFMTFKSLEAIAERCGRDPDNPHLSTAMGLVSIASLLWLTVGEHALLAGLSPRLPIPAEKWPRAKTPLVRLMRETGIPAMEESLRKIGFDEHPCATACAEDFCATFEAVPVPSVFG